LQQRQLLLGFVERLPHSGCFTLPRIKIYFATKVASAAWEAILIGLKLIDNAFTPYAISLFGLISTDWFNKTYPRKKAVYALHLHTEQLFSASF